MHDAPTDEQPIVISAEHLESVAAQDPRVELERGMSYAAWLTMAVGALCVAAFVWEIMIGALGSQDGLLSAGALMRQRVLDGELWRLFSSMFLHAGFDHLLGNMLVLYVLGMACEHAIGRGRMALVYLFTGLIGGLLTILMDDRPTVGASGAIFGLLGFLIAFLYRHRKRIMVRENRIAVVLAIWAAYQIFMGFLDPAIANWAHIGGLLSGAGLGLVVTKANGRTGLDLALR
jgi:rhomboid protease GluP